MATTSHPISGAVEQLIRKHLYDLYKLVEGVKEEQGCDNTWQKTEILSTNISGDMNHVYRVSISMYHALHDHLQKELSVVVKMAPSEVLFMKEEENIPVDQSKIEHEYNSLHKFHDLQEGSVPTIFVLDVDNKAIIMEDLQDFKTLTDLLAFGEMKGYEPQLAVKRATQFIGLVHRKTWLADKSSTEREALLKQFGNPSMRLLMSELLFDKLYKPEDQSYSREFHADIDSMKSDPAFAERIAAVKTAFLNQDDCLCHGDFATDNILIKSGDFKVIDMEFSGIGLRAYDLALLLQMTLLQLLRHHNTPGNHTAVQGIFVVIHEALNGYTAGVGGQEMVQDPLFVDQVCSLIACEFLWTRCRAFDGEPEQGKKLLSLAKQFLLHSKPNETIVWNISRHLSDVYGINF